DGRREQAIDQQQDIRNGDSYQQPFGDPPWERLARLPPAPSPPPKQSHACPLLPAGIDAARSSKANTPVEIVSFPPTKVPLPMQPHQVRTLADARKIVLERDLSYIKVGVFDIDGILRGKYVSRDKFFSALEGGFGFCDVVLGWDSGDVLYDNVAYTGWHTAYPDAPVRILPETCRALTGEMDGKGLFFMGEFAEPADTV